MHLLRRSFVNGRSPKVSVPSQGGSQLARGCAIGALRIRMAGRNMQDARCAWTTLLAKNALHGRQAMCRFMLRIDNRSNQPDDTITEHVFMGPCQRPLD